jgi:hypothetical protein
MKAMHRHQAEEAGKKRRWHPSPTLSSPSGTRRHEGYTPTSGANAGKKECQVRVRLDVFRVGELADRVMVAMIVESITDPDVRRLEHRGINVYIVHGEGSDDYNNSKV